MDGEYLLDTWQRPDTGRRFTAWLGPGEHDLTVEYAHPPSAASLRLAITPWPVTPVFAAEDAVGAYDQLPLAAAPFVGAAPLQPAVPPSQVDWWRQLQTGAQEWWTQQQNAPQAWWNDRQAEMQQWWDNTQRELELAWQEWLDNLTREVQEGIQEAINNMVAEFSRWVETQVQQFVVQTCGGTAAPGLVMRLWVAYRRRR